MAMSIEDQQQTLAEFLDRTIADFLLDYPSVNPRIASITLLDFATLLSLKQGATVEQIITRVRSATEKAPPK